VRRQTAVVGILGGMGPAAGADFLRLFVDACAARLQHDGHTVNDQAFPEHWLAQLPIPDRTHALQDTSPGTHQPLEPMLQAVGRLAALGVRHLAIACNTAHAWHTAIQERFPRIDVLHIAQEVALVLSAGGTVRAGLLATEGTYSSGIYQKALADTGLVCHIPLEAERSALMHGIYKGVKAGDLKLANRQFQEVASALIDRHALDVLVLGCTEIPLALRELEKHPQVQLIDPTQVLAQALADKALGACSD